MRNNRGLLIGGGIVVLIVIVFLVVYTTKQGVTSSGNKKEAGLSAQYKDNQNYLSDCEVKTRQAANVATANTDAFDRVISDAVKGRYDQGSTAKPGGGSLFSALREAYPNLTQVGATYQNVLNIITGCRTDYRGMQSKLLDMLAQFDAWRTGSWTTRTFGGSNFPNNNLIASIGSDSWSGQDAEKKMKEIVLISTVAKEYESGQLDPTDPFPSTTTSG